MVADVARGLLQTRIAHAQKDLATGSSPPALHAPHMTAAAKARAEAKAKKKAEREAAAIKVKELREAKKDLPASKAAVWITQLTREIGKLQTLKEEVHESPVPAPLKKTYVDDFDRGVQSFEALKANLESIIGGDPVIGGAEHVVNGAPSIVDGIHRTAKAWRATKKFHAPK